MDEEATDETSANSVSLAKTAEQQLFFSLAKVRGQQENIPLANLIFSNANKATSNGMKRKMQ